MSSDEQQPLFEIKRRPSEQEIAAHVIAIIKSAAGTRYAPDERRYSEAAIDQGHGPQERGVPIEDDDHPVRKPEAIAKQEADNQRRRKRYGQENKFTDIGKDSQPPLHPYTRDQLSGVASKEVSAKDRSITSEALMVAFRRQLNESSKAASYLTNRTETTLMRGLREMREAKEIAGQKRVEQESALDGGC